MFLSPSRSKAWSIRQSLSAVQPLEARVLFASFASLNSRGTLSVVGTSKNDTIVVRFSGSRVKAIVNGQTLSFNKSAVKRIWADAFDGNDTVQNATDLPASLIGGIGKDRLIVGSASQELFPGTFYNEGNEQGDVIDYSTQAAGLYDYGFDSGMARPGGLNDYIDASPNAPLSIVLTPGNDVMEATSPEDDAWRFYLGAGNDEFDAGAEGGFDLVDGGSGNDTFNFNYDSTIESIVGGSGNDTINDDSGYQNGASFDMGSGYDTWNIAPDLPLYGAAVYQRTMPLGLEKLTLNIVAPVYIIGNDLDNDIEIGSGGGATVSGEAGNDRIVVKNFVNDYTDEQRIGSVSLFGDSGNDTLIGTGGPVAFSGGSGHDTADFSARTDNLVITLDNHPNDGATDEGDNVMADIETVIGGSGNDHLQGNPFANKLVGNAGNDTIFGGDGNDTLIGGPGSDQLYGQDGTDVVQQ